MRGQLLNVHWRITSGEISPEMSLPSPDIEFETTPPGIYLLRLGAEPIKADLGSIYGLMRDVYESWIKDSLG